MITVRNLNHSYKNTDGEKALENINVNIEKGEIVANPSAKQKNKTKITIISMSKISNRI